MSKSRPRTLLSRSIDKKMALEGLSWRRAADEAATTHFTLRRVRDGYGTDVLTLRNLCRWLALDTNAVIEDLWGHYGK
jgi:hypothetical protein